LPTITATFPILDPGRLAAVDGDLPSGRACPLFLGLAGDEDLPTIPAQGGWIRSADPQAIMRSLIHRFSFSRSTKNHPGFSAQLITNCLGATGAVQSDEEMRIPGFTASPSLFIGWASRGGKLRPCLYAFRRQRLADFGRRSYRQSRMDSQDSECQSARIDCLRRPCRIIQWRWAITRAMVHQGTSGL
jgi:hypothetical protein